MPAWPNLTIAVITGCTDETGPRTTAGREHNDRSTVGERIAVLVKAAREPVSTVLSLDPQLLARACYHLGNRHVALQIEPGRLRYLQDHVLDEMVRGLGLEVIVEEAPFEPESGAYGGPAHAH